MNQDIVARLRLLAQWPITQDGVTGQDAAQWCSKAADEIERLRLTAEEADNIRFAAKRLNYSEGANMDSCTAAVLSLMLERLGHDSGEYLDE